MASKMNVNVIKKKKKGKNAKKRDTTLGLKVDVTGVGKGQLDFAHTQAPIARSLNATTRNPSVNGSRGFKVAHSEFITDLNSSTTFSVLKLPIQPGLPSSFPWLSDMAPNFEEYRIVSWRARIESQAPTTTPGTLMAVIDYDPADGDPLSKQEFMTKAGATRCAVWNSCACAARSTRRPFSRLYVRTGALASNLDIKTYDYGNLYVGVEGVTGDVVAIGELYIDYEIEFFTPESSGASAVDSGTYTAFFTDISTTAPFSTAPTGVGGSLPIVFANNTQMRIYRVGTYLFTLKQIGTGFTTTTSGSFTGFAENNTQTTKADYNSMGVMTGATPTGTVGSWSVVLEIFQEGDGFSVNLPGTTVTSFELLITPMHAFPYQPSAPLPTGRQVVVKDLLKDRGFLKSKLRAEKRAEQEELCRNVENTLFDAMSMCEHQHCKMIRSGYMQIGIESFDCYK